jgi:8-oxo-dGTP pyrophosphatase MutT (NUDIX family)
MPSSYLLVHAVVPGGARVVLLGNKNIIGNRVHGAPVGQVVWNSAGQVVIPGGRRNGGENWWQSGSREFFEETGVDFRDPAVRAANGVAVWPPVSFVGPGGAYAVTYVEIAGGHINALLTTINNNIFGNVPDDDELFNMFWQPRATAPAVFGLSPNPPVPGSYQDPQFLMVTPANVARRDQQMAAAFGWFVTGTNNCPP